MSHRDCALPLPTVAHLALGAVCVSERVQCSAVLRAAAHLEGRPAGRAVVRWGGGGRSGKSRLCPLHRPPFEHPTRNLGDCASIHRHDVLSNGFSPPIQ